MENGAYFRYYANSCIKTTITRMQLLGRNSNDHFRDWSAGRQRITVHWISSADSTKHNKLHRSYFDDIVVLNSGK